MSNITPNNRNNIETLVMRLQWSVVVLFAFALISVAGLSFQRKADLYALDVKLQKIGKATDRIEMFTDELREIDRKRKEADDQKRREVEKMKVKK
jgi:hypothetical protein